MKRRQSQSYKFKEFAKISNFRSLKQPLYATHLLKLLDKMCKYEMDPMSIVEDTERTRFCPQTDRRTRWNQYTPLSTSLKRGGGGGIMTWWHPHIATPTPTHPIHNSQKPCQCYLFLSATMGHLFPNHHCRRKRHATWWPLPESQPWYPIILSKSEYQWPYVTFTATHPLGDKQWLE